MHDCQTDVSHIRPNPCHSMLPSVLDFIYEGVLSKEPQGLLSTFIIADVLQIKALFDEVLKSINQIVEDGKLIMPLWEDAIALRDCQHQVVTDVSQAAQDAFRTNFKHIVALSLTSPAPMTTRFRR